MEKGTFDRLLYLIATALLLLLIISSAVATLGVLLFFSGFYDVGVNVTTAGVFIIASWPIVLAIIVAYVLYSERKKE